MKLGVKLTTLRRGLEMTQATVAHETGLSQGYLSQLETGVVDNPSIEVVLALCRVLGVDVYELMSEEKQPKPLTLYPPLVTTLKQMPLSSQMALTDFIWRFKSEKGKKT